MHKISNSRTISGVPVRSKHRYWLPFPNDDFLDDWEQVSWDRSQGIVSNKSRMMISSRIEISNWNYFPLRMVLCCWLQEPFKAQFGFSIRTDGSAVKLLCAVILLSVNSSWRREEELFTRGMFLHHLEEIHGARQVVVKVVQGFIDRLRCGFLCSEVKDSSERSVEIFLLLKDRVEEVEIQYISLVEVDPFFVRCDVSPFRQIMRNRFKYPC